MTAIAAGTTLIAVVLFGVAARLSPVPPAICRLLAVWLVFSATALQVAAGPAWRGALIGGAAVLAMVLIHQVQIRRKPDAR